MTFHLLSIVYNNPELNYHTYNTMDTKRKVSACIIAYNIENFIADCIEGALSQKLDNPYEIVIQEDCSTDRTREIVLEYQRKYPDKIRAILNEKNIGQAENFLRSIEACEGDYIAFCDGDDVWTDPLKIKLQLEEMGKHPECDMCFHPSTIQYMIRKGNSPMKAYHGDSVKIFDTKKSILVGGSLSPTSSLVFRKSVITALRKFTVKYDLSLGGDSDDFIEIFGSLHGGLLYLPRCMAVYRFEVPGSWSDKDRKFENSVRGTRTRTYMLSKLNEYLDYKYSKEIQYKITLTHYTLWRRFMKVDKKTLDDYKKTREEVYSLPIDKKILARILFKSLKRKLKSFFSLLK